MLASNLSRGRAGRARQSCERCTVFEYTLSKKLYPGKGVEGGGMGSIPVSRSFYFNGNKTYLSTRSANLIR